MGKRPDLSVEMVDAAREVVRKTRDAGELRKALSVVLSGVMGLTLPRVGDLIGRSRATVARFHAEFRGWLSGRQDKDKSWGSRRRAYLTFEEEKGFLSGFLRLHQEVGFWWSAEYALLWKRDSGTRWLRLPYTGCWTDTAGEKSCRDDAIPGPIS